MSKSGLIKRLETLEEKKCPSPDKKIIVRMWEPDPDSPGKSTERITIIPLTAEDAKEYYEKGGTDEIIVEVVENKPPAKPS